MRHRQSNSLVQDKWILASAVQKLIRRAASDHAEELAFQLERQSPGYLRRRLPVIAYEEVGAANLADCLRVIRLCADGRLWSDPQKVICETIMVLAEAPKSRTACDAACLSLADPEIAAAQASLQTLSRDKLLALATQPNEAWARRAAALALLGSRQHMASVEFQAMLVQVAEAFRLPPAGHELFARQNRDVAPMALMLPLAVEAVAGQRQQVDAQGLPGSGALVRGVPLFALDKYSRAGREAMSEFCRRSDRLARIRLQIGPSREFDAAVSMAVFHLDSSKLRREIVTEASERLRQRIEGVELMRLGINEEHRSELYQAIQADAELLNSCRKAVLRGVE